jgi:hypothetical protein
VFESLWEGAGSLAVPCRLNILDTVLFSHGVPVRWIGTNDRGFLQRKELFEDRTAAASGKVHEVGPAKAAVPAAATLHRMHAIRDEFFRFMVHHGGGASEDKPFVVVWYASGSQEVMTLEEFSKVLGEPLWLAKVAALQPYPETNGSTFGLFKRTLTRRGPRLVRVEEMTGSDAALESEAAMRAFGSTVSKAVDGVTERLAKYVQLSHKVPDVAEPLVRCYVVDGGFHKDRPERATPADGPYLPRPGVAQFKSVMEHGESEAEEEDDAGLTIRSDESALGKYSSPYSRVRVLRLIAHWVVTLNGELWLSHVSEVITQKLTMNVEHRVVMDGGLASHLAAEELMRATNDAEAELRSLLNRSFQRGLTMKQVFSHFDPHGDGTGRASDDSMRGALHQLGIDLPPGAMNTLLARFPRGKDNCIGLSEFQVFVQAAASASASEAEDRTSMQSRLRSSRRDPLAGSHAPARGELVMDESDDADGSSLRQIRTMARDELTFAGNLPAGARKMKMRFIGGETWEGDKQMTATQRAAEGESEHAKTESMEEFIAASMDRAESLEADREVRRLKEQQRVRQSATAVTEHFLAQTYSEGPSGGEQEGKRADLQAAKKRLGGAAALASVQGHAVTEFASVIDPAAVRDPALESFAATAGPIPGSLRSALGRDPLSVSMPALPSATAAHGAHKGTAWGSPGAPGTRPTDVADAIIDHERRVERAQRRLRKGRTTRNPKQSPYGLKGTQSTGRLTGKPPLSGTRKPRNVEAQIAAAAAAAHETPEFMGNYGASRATLAAPPTSEKARRVWRQEQERTVVGRLLESSKPGGWSGVHEEMTESIDALKRADPRNRIPAVGSRHSMVLSIADEEMERSKAVGFGKHDPESERFIRTPLPREFMDANPPLLASMSGATDKFRDTSSFVSGDMQGPWKGQGSVNEFLPGLLLPTRGALAARGASLDWKVHWYDQDTSLVYAILEGPKMAVTSAGAVLAEGSRAASAAQSSSRAHGGPGRPGHVAPIKGLNTAESPYASGRPVDILVLCDLYDDIHGVAAVLRPVVKRLPGSRILLVNYPGLAGTTWNEHPKTIRPSRAVDELDITALKYELGTRRKDVPHPAARYTHDKPTLTERQQFLAKVAGVENTMEAVAPKEPPPPKEEEPDPFDTLFPDDSPEDRQVRVAARAIGMDPMPGTSTNRAYRPLTGDFLALTVLDLLKALRERGDFGPAKVQDFRTDVYEKTKGRIGRDMIVLGSGMGAFVGATFAWHFAARPTPIKGYAGLAGGQDKIIASSVRALCFINGFAHVDRDLALVFERLCETHDPLAAMAGLRPDGPSGGILKEARTGFPKGERSLPNERTAMEDLTNAKQGIARAEAVGSDDEEEGGDMPVDSSMATSADVLQRFTRRERQFRRRMGLRGARVLYDRKEHDGADPDEDRAHSRAGRPETAPGVSTGMAEGRSRAVDVDGDWNEGVRNVTDLRKRRLLHVYGDPEAATGDHPLNRPIRSFSNQQLLRLLVGEEYRSSIGEKTSLQMILAHNRPLSQGDPYLDLGIAALCRGMARSRDVREGMKKMPIPLLLITGTDDAFVLPVNSYNMARTRSMAGGGKGTVNGPDSGGHSFQEFLEIAGSPPKPRYRALYMDAMESSTAGATEGTDRPDEITHVVAPLSGRSADGKDISDQDFALYDHELEDGFFPKNPTHVVWLRSGHSTVHERRAYVLQCLEQLFLGRVVRRPETPRPVTGETVSDFLIPGADPYEDEFAGAVLDSTGSLASAYWGPKSSLIQEQFLLEDQAPTGAVYGVEHSRWVPGGGADLNTRGNLKTPQSTAGGGGGQLVLHPQHAKTVEALDSPGSPSQGGGGTFGGAVGSLERQSAGLAKLREELDKRDLSTDGTEFELLARLEEVLEIEAEQARLRVDKARNDRVGRLRRKKRVELVLAHESADQRAARALKTQEEARLLNEERRKAAELVREERYRKELAEEDRLSAAYEAHLRDEAHSLRREQERADHLAVLRERMGEEGAAAAAQKLAMLDTITKGRDKKAKRLMEVRERLQSEVLISFRTDYGDDKFGLDSGDPRAIAAGAERLVDEIRSARVRRKGIVRLWRQLDHSIKDIQHTIEGRTREIQGVETALKRARKEQEMLQTKLAGSKSLNRDESIMLETVNAEVDELAKYRKSQKKYLARLEDQLNVALLELDSTSASTQLSVNTVTSLEVHLLDVRLLLSKMIREVRDARRNATLDQERAGTEASKVLDTLTRKKQRLQEMRVELRRCRSIKGKWVDTVVWQETAQRIKRVDLIRYLKKEIAKIREEVRTLEEDLRRLRARIEGSDTEVDSSSSDLALLEGALRQVVDVMREVPLTKASDQDDPVQAAIRALDATEAVENAAGSGGKVRSTPYGALLTRRDSNQQWRTVQLDRVAELDSLVSTMRDAGERLSKYGAEYAWALDLKALVAVHQARGGALLIGDRPESVLKSLETASRSRAATPSASSAIVPFGSRGSTVHKSSDQLAEAHEKLAITDWCKLAVVTRWKPASDRSAEEKEFIALDRKLFPEMYGYVTKEDNEVYKTDRKYRCNIPLSILEGLVDLPVSLTQALAYMNDKEHVKAHGVLSKFLYGMGEDVERLVDQDSGARAVAAAAVARGFAARIKLPHMRSEEEKEWVALDVVLRPFLYVTPGPTPENDGPMADSVSEGTNDSDEMGIHQSRPGSASTVSTKVGVPKSAAARGGRDAEKPGMVHALDEHAQEQEQLKEAARDKLRRQAEATEMLRRKAEETLRKEREMQARAQKSTVDDAVRREQLRRPPGGQPCPYTQEELLMILSTPPVRLNTPEERRAQLLMRAYGSDGGKAMYELATAAPTPVVYGLAEVSEARELISEGLRARGEVDPTPELMIADADGDRSNVAAVAVAAASTAVLVRSTQVATLLSIENQSIGEGRREEHAFVVPGSLANVVGHGPRAWGAIPNRGGGHWRHVDPDLASSRTAGGIAGFAFADSPPPGQRPVSVQSGSSSQRLGPPTPHGPHQRPEAGHRAPPGTRGRPLSAGSQAGITAAQNNPATALDNIGSTDPLMPTFTGGQRKGIPQAAVAEAIIATEVLPRTAGSAAAASEAGMLVPFTAAGTTAGGQGRPLTGATRPLTDAPEHWGDVMDRRLPSAGASESMHVMNGANDAHSRGLLSAGQREVEVVDALYHQGAPASTYAKILRGAHFADEQPPIGIGDVAWRLVDEEENRRRRIIAGRMRHREGKIAKLRDEGRSVRSGGAMTRVSRVSQVGSDGAEADDEDSGEDAVFKKDDWDSEDTSDDDEPITRPPATAESDPFGVLGGSNRRVREGEGRTRKPLDPYEEETGCPGAKPVCIDLTVTVTYKGDFRSGSTQYVPGRLQVALLRDPFVEPSGDPQPRTAQVPAGGLAELAIAREVIANPPTRLFTPASAWGGGHLRQTWVGDVDDGAEFPPSTRGAPRTAAESRGHLPFGGAGLPPSRRAPTAKTAVTATERPESRYMETGRSAGAESVNTEPWMSSRAHGGGLAVEEPPAPGFMPVLEPGHLNQPATSQLRLQARLQHAETQAILGPGPEELGIRTDGPIGFPAVPVGAALLDRLRRTDEIGVGPTGVPLESPGEVVLRQLREEFEQAALGDRPVPLHDGMAGKEDREEEDRARRVAMESAMKAGLSSYSVEGSDAQFDAGATATGAAASRRSNMVASQHLENALKSGSLKSSNAKQIMTGLPTDDDLISESRGNSRSGGETGVIQSFGSVQDVLDAVPDGERASIAFRPDANGVVPWDHSLSTLAPIPKEDAKFVGYAGPPVPVNGVEFSSAQRDGTSILRIQNPISTHVQVPPCLRPIPRDPYLPDDQTVAMCRFPLGWVDRSDAAPSSTTSIGRMIIHHEPMHVPVVPGRYRVCVFGVAPSSYSVSVVARLAYPARDIVEGCVRTVDDKIHRIPKCRSESADIEMAYRLGARKRHLVRDLLSRTEKAMTENALDSGKLRDALNRGFIVRKDLGSDAENVESQSESEEDSEEEEVEESESSGDSEDSDARKVRLQAEAIAAERRRMQKLDLTESVRELVVLRLARKEEEFAALVRSHSSRNDEKLQIEEGLLALREAKAEREAELRSLVVFLREYRRYVPKAAKALLPLGGSKKRVNRARRASLLAKFGLEHLIDTEGKQDVARRLVAAGGDSHGALGPIPIPPEVHGRSFTLKGMPTDDMALVLSTVSPAPTKVDLDYVALGPVIAAWMAKRQRGGTLPFVRPEELTPAERVRRKPVGEMSRAEAEWASMDRVLHPEFYAHLAEVGQGGAPEDDADSEVEMERLMHLTPGREEATRAAGEAVRGLPGGPTDDFSKRVEDVERARGQSRQSASSIIHLAHDRADTPGAGERPRPNTREDERRQQLGLGEFASHPQEAVLAIPENHGHGGSRPGTSGPRSGQSLVDLGREPTSTDVVRSHAEAAGWDMTATGLLREHFTAGMSGEEAARPSTATSGMGGLIGTSNPSASVDEIGAERQRALEDMRTGAADSLVDTRPLPSPPASRGGPRPTRTELYQLREMERQREQDQPWGRPVLPECAFSRFELTRIATVPVQQLTNDERRVRNILARFHDKPLPSFMQARQGAGGDGMTAQQAVVARAQLATPGTPSLQATAGRMALRMEDHSKALSMNNLGPSDLAPAASAQPAGNPHGMTGDEAAMLSLHNTDRNKGRGVFASGPGVGASAGTELRKLANTHTKSRGGGVPGAPAAPPAAGFGEVNDTGAIILATNVKETDETRPKMAQSMEDEDPTMALIRAKKAAEPDPSETRMKRGEFEFHNSSSLHMMAFTAVPIPKLAPKKLKDLLSARATQVQQQWNELVKRTAKGRGELSATVGGIGVEAGDRRMVNRLTHQDAGNISMTADVDERCRDLLAEMDRAYSCGNPDMDSSVLHGTEQRFDTASLRVEIERELDRVLLSMVFEREHVEEALLSEVADAKADDARRKAEEAEAKLAEARDEVLRQMEVEEQARREAMEEEMKDMEKAARAEIGGGGVVGDLAAAAAELEQERKQLKEKDGATGRKRLTYVDDPTDRDPAMDTLQDDLVLDLDDYYEPDEADPIRELGALALWGAPEKPITPRRAREIRSRVLAQKQKESIERSGANAKGGEALQGRLGLLRQRRLKKAAEISGEDSGNARRLRPWRPHENPEELRGRLVEVEAELLRVRMLPEEQLLCKSRMTLSFLRGGSEVIPVDDAIEELAMEAQELKNRLRLIDLDRELHFAYSTSTDFITTTSLHGVPQQAPRKEAIAALEADSARILARQVAQGILDDTLEWMLEGWIFGERESHLPIAGAITNLSAPEQGLRPFESLSETARLFSLRGPAARAAAADAARGLAPVVGDPLRNIKAAATLRELDPLGSKFPEAHVPAAGIIPAETAELALAQLQSKISVGMITDGELGGQDTQGVALLARLPGTPSEVLARDAPSVTTGDLTTLGGTLAQAGQGGQMVHYDPRLANLQIQSAQQRLSSAMEAARVSGDPAIAALAIGAGLGELTGLAGGDGRLTPDQRWVAIQAAVTMRDAIRRAVEQRQAVEHAMNETERTLKIAMFLMTLHYFRAVVQLKQQRAIWQGSGDADLLKSGPKLKLRTAERERMDAAIEAREKRVRAMRQANEAATAGWKKLHAVRQQQAQQVRSERAREERKLIARTQASIRIQKTVRGFLERLHVFRWAEAERKRQEEEARQRKAATDIQRVFRGYIGRKVSEAERKRLGAFVRWLRKQEEKMAVDEYYRNNTIKRWQKNVKEWWGKRQDTVKEHAKKLKRRTDVPETGKETDEQRRLEGLGVEYPNDDDDASDDSGLEDIDIARLGGDGAFFGDVDPAKAGVLKSSKGAPPFRPSTKYAKLLAVWTEQRKTREARKAAQAAEDAARATAESAAAVSAAIGASASSSAARKEA